MLESAHASSWKAIVKHSGILPVSWNLEIRQSRGIYAKEIGKCYDPGLFQGSEEARLPAYAYLLLAQPNISFCP